LLTRYAYLLALNNTALDRARDMALTANTIIPDHPDTEHTLGWIAFRSGDLEEAKTYLEACLDHGGGESPVVLEHFGDILVSLGETDEAVIYWQLSRDKGNSSGLLARKITERRLIH
jgi:tetratricopeptide (TPR) repeat protein